MTVDSAYWEGTFTVTVELEREGDESSIAEDLAIEAKVKDALESIELDEVEGWTVENWKVEL